ncbi:hypothetical protein KDJ21_007265 [Metabacillus litoralis]|uniref:hypothetical protein n=1 Tax=Metabacillus TaxID=2675233 RepID=UPI001B9A173F|nr:hypothetical protein [Metabacillus litoralis]UHA61448.1 hypothetical protein KDJ21_007265 [Metabacillus litoralis]
MRKIVLLIGIMTTVLLITFSPKTLEIQAAEVQSATPISDEPNDLYSAATPIELNKEYESTFADDKYATDGNDIYKIEIPSSGLVTVKVDSKFVGGTVSVLLTNGKVNNEYLHYVSNPSVMEDETGQVGLPAGTYYLEISGGTFDPNETFNFSVTFEEGDYFEKEDNDTWNIATEMEFNKRYKGFFVSHPRTDDGDTYRFTLTKDSTIIINHGKYPTSYGNLRVYDSSGKQVFIDYLTEIPVDGKDLVNEVTLKAGTYFLEVSEHINHALPSFPYEVEINVKETKASNEYPWIGRVLIQKEGMALYNPNGKVHRKLKKGEGLKVYEIEDDRYQVGAGYYVLKGSGKDTLYYYGHVWAKSFYMYVYTPEGDFFKRFQARQTVRVYGMEDGKYQVGGGYYVIPDTNIQLDR